MKIYRPTIKNALLNCSLVGIGTFLLTSFILGWDKWIYTGICGILGFFIYYGRFILMTPREVRVGEEGISITDKSGRKTYIPWKSVKSVMTSRLKEDIWEIHGINRTIIFTDDGFSVLDWEELSNEIKRHLNENGIPFEVKESS